MSFYLCLYIFQDNPKIRANQIEALCNELTSRLDNLGGVLKSQLQVCLRLINCFQFKNLLFFFIFQEQRQAEEQERLKKIQDALEKERQLKLEEEQKRREEEETRKRFVNHVNIECYSFVFLFVRFYFLQQN